MPLGHQEGNTSRTPKHIFKDQQNTRAKKYCDNLKKKS